ncbi:MAG: GNA1162 family protein [Methylococcaceae bacterium]
MKRFLIGSLLISTLLSACTTIEKKDYSAFYAHRPRSIVVVPALNNTTEITATPVFASSITAPLAERGYYVFPVYLTDILLKDLGLSEAGHIHQLPASRFRDLFGADAVLLVTIKDWSTKYILISSSVVVKMHYELKDTQTGLTLWQKDQEFAQDSGGAGGGGIAGLVVMAVQAAVNAIATDYLPLARSANQLAFQPSTGLPAGPYHPEYQSDQSKF